MSKQIGCPDYRIGSTRIDHVRHQLQADAGVVLAGHAAVITSRIKTKQGTVKNSALGMHVNWVDSIMQCVTTVTYRVKLNGVLTYPFVRELIIDQLTRLLVVEPTYPDSSPRRDMGARIFWIYFRI